MSRVLGKLIVFSASQEITCSLWNQKVDYRVYKIPRAVPVLKQMNSVHNLEHYFPKINVIFSSQSASWSSEWCIQFRITNQKFVCISYLPINAKLSTHFFHLDLINLTIFSEEYTNYEASH
jgi:hypothetical protein